MSRVNRSFSCRGLQPLKEGDKLYGRDVEIAELSNRIQENLHTILYGQSGAGKSSVIEAGVFPVLRKKGFFPVVVRFMEIGSTDYAEYVINQVRMAAVSSSDFKKSYSIRPQAQVDGEGVAELLAFFQGNIFVDENGEQFTPVLVFDQFEEVLNNPDTYERGEKFIKDIYPLIDDSYCLGEEYLSYSNYRILFSIREDFLYAFEDIIDKNRLAELKQNRIRIRFLDEECAASVVTKILLNNILNTNDNSLEDVDRLARMIVKESKNTSYSFGVNTPTLSMICYQIIRNGLRIQEISESTISRLIYSFYDNAVSGVSYKCRNYIEGSLITKDGRRASVDLKDAIGNGSITPDDIDKLVDETRLLSIINIGNTRRLEFSHDIIVKIINSKRATIFQSIINVLKKPFQFGGYASKEDFFAYVSFNSVLWALLFIVCVSDGALRRMMPVVPLLLFVCILPLVSVTVRRLHSVGRSGWWILVPLLPLFWVSKADSVMPYRGRLSNVPMFDLWLDWKTPPIRKMCNQRVYIARHIYSLYIGIICYFLFCCLLPLFFPQDWSIAYAETDWAYEAYLMVLQNRIVNTYMMSYFWGLIMSYWIYGTKCVLLAMRLPRMGFRRFWAFIPIISWGFWIYGFWPDSHFDKKRRVQEVNR